MAGNSLHCAIGSDLDGTYGTEQSPMDLDTIGDLQNLEGLLQKRGYSKEDIENMTIVKNNKIHMANLAIVGSFSVNGVAALHTEILKADTLKAFHNYFKGKINNKTNGVTHRRWLLNCNEELSNEITAKIGDKWMTDLDQLQKLQGTNIEFQLKF